VRALQVGVREVGLVEVAPAQIGVFKVRAR
jgi:hypothetical protein